MYLLWVSHTPSVSPEAAPALPSPQIPVFPRLPLPPWKQHLQAFSHYPVYVPGSKSTTFWSNLSPEFKANKYPGSGSRHLHLRLPLQQPEVICTLQTCESHPQLWMVALSLHTCPNWALVRTSPQAFTQTPRVWPHITYCHHPYRLHPSPPAQCFSKCLGQSTSRGHIRLEGALRLGFLPQTWICSVAFLTTAGVTVLDSFKCRPNMLRRIALPSSHVHPGVLLVT